MNNDNFRVGAATMPIVPPLGIDMLGFVNRTVPGQGYGEPMEVGAIVAESGGERVVIVAIDMVLCPLATAEQIRARIAEAASCRKHAVLINLNHSHALPAFPGEYKMGGVYPEATAAEYMFADYAAAMAVSVAQLAASRLEEAEMVLGASIVEGISVNRRERTPDGRTILGWNPDGVCDRSVQTVCFKRRDQSVIATAVNFSCHPVVVGKNVPEYSSDYVGPLRSTVKKLLGGECIFLQGGSGNILPLEGFCETKGKEVEFGAKVALTAVESLLDPIEPEMTVAKSDFGSVTPISLYRRQRKESASTNPVVSAVEEWVRFPLQTLPTREELLEEVASREREIAEMKGKPDAQTFINPIKYHVDWAKTIIRKMDDGTLTDYVEAPLQAIRIGNLALSAAPGEIFNEIGLAVKERSTAKMTLYCGYSNGLLGYFATAAEYPHRGYEPSVSHRGYALPAPFDEQCESILIDKGAGLVNRLFGG